MTKIVLKFISKSKADTSAGPDGIPNFFLKQFRFALLNPLITLFRYVVILGHIPKDWKLANITPIFKKGIASEVSNYRTVSLTSVFCKLFERLLHAKTLHYLRTNKLITSQQHSFLTRHSTCTQWVSWRKVNSCLYFGLVPVNLQTERMSFLVHNFQGQ